MAIQQSDDGQLRELALFAGAGGGILGGKLLGWRTVCAVERDAYAAQVLAQRQNDGALAPFPIWSDVCSFDGKPWRGRVDVISGGFPCQDISAAGRGAGITGERSGLWSQFARIIREVRPRFVFVENSPVLTSRGLGVVLGDLAEMGYDAEWGVLGSADVGGDCEGLRIWIVAKAASGGRAKILHGKTRISKKKKSGWKAGNAYTHLSKRERVSRLEEVCGEPAIMGGFDGLAYRVDRLKAIGNGQVPTVAATAFTELRERLIPSD